MKSLYLTFALFAFMLSPAQAGVIDFEGLGDIQPALPISTGDNRVTFSCGLTPNVQTCRTFHYGGPVTSFGPTEIPVGGFGDGTRVGFVGLDDTARGNRESDNYFFQFDREITSLMLDFVDADGIGRTHTLTLFATRNFLNEVGTISYVVPSNRIDQDVIAIGLTLSGVTAQSARFTNGQDSGLTVDNLTFDSIPVSEPGALGGLALGLLSLGLKRRRRMGLGVRGV